MEDTREKTWRRRALGKSTIQAASGGYPDFGTGILGIATMACQPLDLPDLAEWLGFQAPIAI